MFKIANEEAPNIRAIRPELTQELADVVARALTKRPELRYQDGDQFAADLKNISSLPNQTNVPSAMSATGQSKNPVASDKTVAFSATVPATARTFEKTAAQGAYNQDTTPKTGGADIEL
jgi:serine/threonine-protein kinase